MKCGSQSELPPGRDARGGARRSRSCPRRTPTRPRKRRKRWLPRSRGGVEPCPRRTRGLREARVLLHCDAAQKMIGPCLNICQPFTRSGSGSVPARKYSTYRRSGGVVESASWPVTRSSSAAISPAGGMPLGRVAARVVLRHHLAEDRRGERSAGGTRRDRLRPVEAEPDAGDDFRRHAHEPDVRVVVRRAGLARHRDARRQVPPHARRRAAIDDFAHHVAHDERDLRVDHLTRRAPPGS